MDARELELLRPLGQGGFGTVWLARLHGRDGFNRRVAVKLMKDAGVAADVVARQRDEARLLGLLHHPHIVQVLDLTEHQGLPAVVMEYVEGADLSAVLKHEGPLPLAAVLAVGSAVAGALHAGWTARAPDTDRPLRVIHRDIKPGNILVTVHGAVKVLDFGVARADFDREGQTQSMAFGTPRFMAPEQFTGGEVTAANDVYALGVTLWELAVGRAWERPPLAEERFLLRVREQLAAAPLPVRPLLAQMLAWEPVARPSAGEVAEALDSIAPSGESLRAWAVRVLPSVMARQAFVLAGSSSAGTPAPAAAAAAAPAPEPAVPPVPAPAAPEPVDSGVSLVAPVPPHAGPAAAGPGRALTVALAGGGVLLVLAGIGVLGAALWWMGRAPVVEPAPEAVAAPPLPGAPVDAPPPAVAAVPEAAAIEAAPFEAPPPAPGGAPAPRTPSPKSSPAGPSPAELVAGLAPEPAGPAPAAPRPEPKAEPRPEPRAEPPTPAAAPAAPKPEPAGAAPDPVRTRPLRVLADVIGAQVRIDGAAVGQTPLAARPLAYGDHLIEVEVDGVAARRTVTIDANTAGTLRYRSKERKWVWE